MDSLAALADPRRYAEQIDRLHIKNLCKGKLYELKQDGITLASIVGNRNRVARLLAREVARGKYQIAPGEARRVEIAGKERVLYSFCLTDTVVHGVVAGVINDSMQTNLSPHLYSYVRGRSWLDAIRDFARYVRAHRRRQTNPRRRGLYVLRRDICKYTDSIPLDDGSPLWHLLKTLLLNGDASPPAVWPLVQGVVRPAVYNEQGHLSTNLRGVPTGSPISTTMFNLYLMPLDDELEHVPGAFYARYSDDFLFAHPDANVVRRVNGRINALLDEHGLETNRLKDRILYFNGAGRSSEVWPESEGTQRVEFLGGEIDFHATVALKQKKARWLLHDLRERAWRTRKNVEGAGRDEIGRAVCSALNRALDPHSGFHTKSTMLLRKAVTDRQQLAQLDHAIARIVLRVVSGHESVCAFRQIPYRRIRREWKLVSLLHARNRHGCRGKRHT